jgi:peptidoglycan/LPS O-acetylase OafA/YrhL
MNKQKSNFVPSRIDGLDGLRGIAIGLVLIHHLHAYLLTWWPAGGGLAGGDAGQVLNFLWVGVDLFYVLSGFFISLAVLRAKEWDPQRFARSRLTRILPAYYISMLFALLFVEYAMLGSAQGWAAIGLHVLMLHQWQSWSMFLINGPYWTLGVEFCFYLVMMVVAPWWRMRQGWLLIPFFCTVAWVWRAAVFYGVDEPQRFFFAVQIPGALDEFALGMLVAWCHQKTWLDLRGARAAWVGVIGLLLGVGLVAYCLKAYALGGSPYWVSAWHVVWSKTILCAGFTGALVGFVVWRVHNPVLELLRWVGVVFLGRISYSVYLYHVPVLLLVYRHVDALHSSPNVFVMVCVAGSLLLAWVSYRLVEVRWHPSA